MTKMLGGCAALVMALALGACVDDQTQQQDPTDTPTATTDPAPVVVQVPRELSFGNLTHNDGQIQGNEFVGATPDACHVTLVYCADPRYSPHYPSFCSNGCTFPADFKDAIDICHDVCGKINCNTMYDLGGC